MEDGVQVVARSHITHLWPEQVGEPFARMSPWIHSQIDQKRLRFVGDGL